MAFGTKGWVDWSSFRFLLFRRRFEAPSVPGLELAAVDLGEALDETVVGVLTIMSNPSSSICSSS